MLGHMAKRASTGDEPPTARGTARAARLTREAAALRANLHKRKEQARAQKHAGLPPDPNRTDP